MDTLKFRMTRKRSEKNYVGLTNILRNRTWKVKIIDKKPKRIKRIKLFLQCKQCKGTVKPLEKEKNPFTSQEEHLNSKPVTKLQFKA